MASIAEFIFLNAIPIWSGAALIVKWIESWDVDMSFGADATASSPEEMARRIAFLEDVVKSERARPTGEVGS